VTALRGRPLLGHATLQEVADLIVRQRVPMVQDRPLSLPPQSMHLRDSFGEIKLDLAANRVFDGDTELDVSPREIDLLRVLILNAGHLGVLGRLAEKARPLEVEDPERSRLDRDLLCEALENIVAAQDGNAMNAIGRAIEAGRQVLEVVSRPPAGPPPR
jgi:hypothetical protein